MTNEELIAAFGDLKTEISTKFAALESAINANPDAVPDTVVAAFNDLKSSVDGITVPTAAAAPATPETPVTGQ